MTYYRRVGEVPTKRHVRFAPRGDDGLAFEELMGESGFSAASALLYHRHSPSAIVAIEAVEDHRPPLSADRPLQPRHLRTSELAPTSDLVTGRHVLLGNADVVITFASVVQDSPLYRNSIGDELVYVQRGRGCFESVFGRLEVGPGDYVVVPTSTTGRWLVLDGPLDALLLEATAHVSPPRRYQSDRGQFLEGAPYCERDIRGPDQLVNADDADVPVLVRHRGGLTRFVHAHHPFDVVGWDGTLYPWALSIHDFEPIVGALHQPPPVHQTFEGPRFVVCSFVPRLYDFGRGAIKVPYHHANVDSDEVIFYSAGDFMSRSGAGIVAGSITVHPAGFVHGPQPGSLERAAATDRTDELAVMIDTFTRLNLSDAARDVAAPDYPWTWARNAAADSWT